MLSSHADILCDWISVLKRHKTNELAKQFMYTVQPVFAESVSEENDWKGSLNRVEKILNEQCSLVRAYQRSSTQQII